MENKNKPELSQMPMRSDERLARRIAEEVLPQWKADSILDIGCGDGVVSEYLEGDCSYQGLDINDACIYEQKHDNPNVQYIEAAKIPELMKREGPWDTILLLDVIEHTRDFTGLFNLAIERCTKHVIVSLPNELFILDRIRMLTGKELNAHSLDRIKDPEGFKHQFIININKAKKILSDEAAKKEFELKQEILRPLTSKKRTLRLPLFLLKILSSPQLWSMGSILIYTKKSK